MIKKKSYLYLLRVSFLLLLIAFFTGCTQKTSRDDGSEALPASKNYAVKQKNFYQIGETFQVKQPTQRDEQNVGYECRIKKVMIYNKPADGGIQKEQLGQVEYHKSTGDIEMKSVEEVWESPILVAEIDLTNINEENEPNIGIVSLVAADKEDNLYLLGLPTYFPNSISKPDESDFYHFSLLKGQSTTLQVGWYINLEDTKKENLYLVVHFMGDEEVTSQINLNL